MAEPVTDDDDYGFNRQLALANAVTPLSHSFSDFDYSPIIHFPSRFFVPDGWNVLEVPRSNGLRIDKYYIEPETGRKFRSRNEVMRYLNDEEYQTSGSRPLRLDYGNENSMDQRMITSGGNCLQQMTPIRRWSNTKFTLPEDWFVEKVPRKSGSTIDKYYYDPETGRKFRSLKDVERYLTEGVTPTRSRNAPRLKYYEKSCGGQKKIISGGKMLDLEEDEDNQYQLVNVTPTSYRSRSPIPDGWIVEEVPRKSSDQIDRYYYEPGTGQKFRSLSAVQKHLAELEENSPLSVVLEDLKENNLPLSKAFKLSTSIKNHGSYDSWKKSVSKTDQASSLNNLPSKINWVMASSGGDSWNAFVDDSLVPDSLQQQWSKSFMFAINNSNHNLPISEWTQE